MKFFLLISFLISSSMSIAQKDSTSHIYLGISAPFTLIHHTAEDAEWYVTKFSPGGSEYQELAKRSFSKGLNIASGGKFFISFDNIFDISIGAYRDLIPYEYQKYLDGVATQKKFNYYRFTLNFTLAVLRLKTVRIFTYAGIQNRNSKILEGLGYFGMGASFPVTKKVSLNAHVDFGGHKELTGGENKFFCTIREAISISYKIALNK